MGLAAGKGADMVVVTSDNPRSEDPDAIIAAIVPGVEQAGLSRIGEAAAREGARGYLVLPDRVLARYRIHPQAKSERLAWASAREDLTVRRRNGMKWRSQAGRELFRLVYVRRVSRRLRAVPGAVRRMILRTPRP